VGRRRREDWHRLEQLAAVTALDADELYVGSVALAGYEDLVLMKEVAGRPRDLNDLVELREARRHQR
jgi:hypothetical protein